MIEIYSANPQAIIVIKVWLSITWYQKNITLWSLNKHTDLIHSYLVACVVDTTKPTITSVSNVSSIAATAENTEHITRMWQLKINNLRFKSMHDISENWFAIFYENGNSSFSVIFFFLHWKSLLRLTRTWTWMCVQQGYNMHYAYFDNMIWRSYETWRNYVFIIWAIR